MDPPGGPVTHWTSPEGARRAVRVRIGELACTSDLQSSKTVSRKRAKYEPLVSSLREAGWNVVGTVHVVTVGVRGTVPLANRTELSCLCITTRKEQLPVQRAMAREAIKHLNIIVRQYRKLSGRRGGRREGGGDRGKLNQGPPCATIPRLLGSLAESRLAVGHHANLGKHSLNKLNNKCNEKRGIG